MRRFLGVVSAVAFVLALAATPASARANDTVTMTCTGGQVIVADAHSRDGQITANTMYNAVNPFGEVCTVST